MTSSSPLIAEQTPDTGQRRRDFIHSCLGQWRGQIGAETLSLTHRPGMMLAGVAVLLVMGPPKLNFVDLIDIKDTRDTKLCSDKKNLICCGCVVLLCVSLVSG